MHICLLSWAKHPSIDTDTREIGRVLVNDGQKVDIIMRNDQLNTITIEEKNLRIHYLPSVNNEFIDVILFNFCAFILLARINKRLSIEIVQCMNFATWLASLLSKIFLRTHLLYNIRAPNIEFYRPFWLPLNIFLIKNSEKIFSISSAYKKFLNGNYGIPLEKIIVIPMGADTTLFSPKVSGVSVRRKYNITLDAKVLVYVGTLSKERRLEIIITAMKYVKNEINGVRILIVGDGDGKVNLLRMSEELGLQDSVIFTGYINNKLVPLYIASANIAVSPIPDNLYYSLSSPTKTFEYMAMGKPVIASNILPHLQIIRNDVNGIIVRWDDPSEYSQAIVTLLKNQSKANEIGNNARNYALMNYDWRVVLLPMTNYLSDLETKKRFNPTKK